MEAADAVVLVSPEYNTGTTAALKNAIDFLNREWKYKPVGFVTYGGANQVMELSAAGMLDELGKVEVATRTLRR